MARASGGQTLLASLILTAALVLGSGGAAAGDYRESFDAGGDPARMMGGALRLGAFDGWSGALEAGIYRLRNESAPGTVRFFHVQPAGPALSASVQVEGSFEGDNAGAGLLYGFDKAAGVYHAFVVMKDGSYGLWRRTAQGISRVAGGTNDAIQAAGVNRLEVRFDGAMAEHYVNESRMVTISTQRPADGGVGIVAFDSGDYRFDDFAVSFE